MAILTHLAELRHFGISGDDLVLEVGSGHMPWCRADILADKYVRDDSERIAPCLMDRPFIAADVANLPFRDHAVDFVYFSHVVEHLLDPIRALQELSRVARRGVIACPSALWEKMFGSRQHRWLVRVEDDALVLHAKSGTLQDPELSKFWHREDAQEQWWRLYRRFARDLEIRHIWSGEIRAVIEGVPPADAGFVSASVSGVKGGQSDLLSRLRLRAKQAALRCMHRVLRCRRPWSLTEILRCPACRGAVELPGPEGLQCGACGALFPRIGDGCYSML